MNEPLGFRHYAMQAGKHLLAIAGGVAAGAFSGVMEAGWHYLSEGTFMLSSGELDFTTLRSRLIAGALAGVFGLYVRKPTLMTPPQEAARAYQRAVTAEVKKADVVSATVAVAVGKEAASTVKDDIKVAAAEIVAAATAPEEPKDGPVGTGR